MHGVTGRCLPIRFFHVWIESGILRPFVLVCVLNLCAGGKSTNQPALHTGPKKDVCVCISASPCHLESPIILLSWVPYDLITVCINMQKCIICFCSSCVGRQFESPHMSHSTYTTGFNKLILNTSSVHSRLEFLPIAQKNWLLSKHQIFMLISGVKMASEPPVTNVTAAVLWGVEMWVSSL